MASSAEALVDPRDRPQNPVRRLLFSQVGLLIIFLAALVAFFTIFSSDHLFWSPQNLANVLEDVAPLLLLAIGQTFVVISGGIDLSVGSTAAAAGVVTALAMRNLSLNHVFTPNVTLVVGFLVALGVGLLVGIINALLINYARLVAFVATLATAGVTAGLAIVFSKGGPVGDGPADQGTVLVRARFFNAFSILAIAMFVVVVIAGLFLHKSRFGRHTFAMGSNSFATRAAGISLKRQTAKVYILSGAMAGLSGMVFYLRLRSGSPNSGIGRELDSIASVVIGGIALTGGVGTLAGSALAAVILSTVANGLVMIGVAATWRQVVVGVLIALAGAVQAFRHTNGRSS